MTHEIPANFQRPLGYNGEPLDYTDEMAAAELYQAENAEIRMQEVQRGAFSPLANHLSHTREERASKVDEQVEAGLELANLYATPTSEIGEEDMNRIDELWSEVPGPSERLAARLASDMSKRDDIRERAAQKKARLELQKSRLKKLDPEADTTHLEERASSLSDALIKDEHLEKTKHAHARAQLKHHAERMIPKSDTIDSYDFWGANEVTGGQPEQIIDSEEMISPSNPWVAPVVELPRREEAPQTSGHSERENTVDEQEAEPEVAQPQEPEAPQWLGDGQPNETSDGENEDSIDEPETPQQADPLSSDILDELRKIREDAAARDARDRRERAETERAAEQARNQQQQQREQQAQMARVENRLKKENQRSEEQLRSGNVYEVNFDFEDPKTGQIRPLMVRMRAQGLAPSLDMAEYEGSMEDGDRRLAGVRKEKQYRMLVMSDNGEFDNFEIELPENAFSNMESFNALDDEGNAREVVRVADLDVSDDAHISGRARDMLAALALVDGLHHRIRMRQVEMASTGAGPLSPAHIATLLYGYAPYFEGLIARFEQTQTEVRGGRMADVLTRLRTGVTRPSRRPYVRTTVWQNDIEAIRSMFDLGRIRDMYGVGA